MSNPVKVLDLPRFILNELSGISAGCPTLKGQDIDLILYLKVKSLSQERGENFSCAIVSDTRSNVCSEDTADNYDAWSLSALVELRQKDFSHVDWVESIHSH